MLVARAPRQHVNRDLVQGLLAHTGRPPKLRVFDRQVQGQAIRVQDLARFMKDVPLVADTDQNLKMELGVETRRVHLHIQPDPPCR